MDTRELKEIQAPLKARYHEDPNTAMITLEAEGRLGSVGVSCSVATGRAMVEAGLHPALGGDGSFACSGDMLLQALVACAGVTLLSVATNRGLEVEGLVRAEGDLDFRGTLGVNRDAADRVQGHQTGVRPHDVGAGGRTQFPHPNDGAILRRSTNFDPITGD